MEKLKWWYFFIDPLRYIREWRAERAERIMQAKKAADSVWSAKEIESYFSSSAAKAGEGSSYLSITKETEAAPPADSSNMFLSSKPAVEISAEVLDLAHDLRKDLVSYVHNALAKTPPAKPEDVETLANKYAALKWRSQELEGLALNIKMTIPRIAALLTELNNIITGSKVSTAEALRALIVDKSKDIDSGNDARFKDQVNDKELKDIINKHLKQINSKNDLGHLQTSRFRSL